MTTPVTNYKALAEEALHWYVGRDFERTHDLLQRLARAVLALDEELREARPLAAQMRQITTRGEEVAREFQAAQHFGLPQAFSGSLNRQVRELRAENQRLRTALEEARRMLSGSSGDMLGDILAGKPQR